MSARVDAARRDCAISVLGGPTTVIDIAGRRIVVDPTFDPPGVHDYLTKLTGPAVSAAALGSVDAVLVSHDHRLAAIASAAEPGEAGRHQA
jgi:L-ascorbate metabolism protein UlaG (beta-lactamase superfamily)